MTCFFDSLCFLEICIGCFRIWCSRYLLKSFVIVIELQIFFLVPLTSAVFFNLVWIHLPRTCCSNRGLESLLERNGLLPSLFHPQVSAQVNITQVSPDHLGKGHFTAQPVQWLLLVQIPNQGLSAYYPMHRWAELLPGLFAYGVGSHNYSRGTFVHR